MRRMVVEFVLAKRKVESLPMDADISDQGTHFPITT